MSYFIPGIKRRKSSVKIWCDFNWLWNYVIWDFLQNNCYWSSLIRKSISHHSRFSSVSHFSRNCCLKIRTLSDVEITRSEIWSFVSGKCIFFKSQTSNYGWHGTVPMFPLFAKRDLHLWISISTESQNIRKWFKTFVGFRCSFTFCRFHRNRRFCALHTCDNMAG